jgi:hypothetical protein
MGEVVMQGVKAVTHTELVDGFIFWNALCIMSRLKVLIAEDGIQIQSNK